MFNYYLNEKNFLRKMLNELKSNPNTMSLIDIRFNNVKTYVLSINNESVIVNFAFLANPPI